MFKPYRSHLFLPQGKTYQTTLTFPVGVDLTGNRIGGRIRKSETTDGPICSATSAPVGSTYTSGAGGPAGGLGVNGDYYRNTTTEDIYFKSGGTWAIVANLNYVDPTVTIDTVARTAKLVYSEAQVQMLVANCTYSQLPVVKTTRQIDINAIQKLATEDLPGTPYFWEIEWENASGEVEPLLWGGVLVPKESNR